MNRGGNAAGGRFSTRTLPPSNTIGTRPNVVPNNGCTDSNRTFNTENSPKTRAEPYHEEHVAVPIAVDAYSSTRPSTVFSGPQHMTDGVVTKVETVVERVYVPDQTSTINGFIRNIQTEVADPNRGPFPGALLHRQTPNSPKSYSGINEAGANSSSKPPVEDIGVGGAGGRIETCSNGWSMPPDTTANNICSNWRGIPSVPPLIKPKTIDSNEAAQKYNGYIPPPPIKPKILDSNEAARKYNGYLAPPPMKPKPIDSDEVARKYKGAIYLP